MVCELCARAACGSAESKAVERQTLEQRSDFLQLTIRTTFSDALREVARAIGKFGSWRKPSEGASGDSARVALSAIIEAPQAAWRQTLLKYARLTWAVMRDSLPQLALVVGTIALNGFAGFFVPTAMISGIGSALPRIASAITAGKESYRRKKAELAEEAAERENQLKVELAEDLLKAHAPFLREPIQSLGTCFAMVRASLADFYNARCELTHDIARLELIHEELEAWGRGLELWQAVLKKLSRPGGAAVDRAIRLSAIAAVSQAFDYHRLARPEEFDSALLASRVKASLEQTRGLVSGIHDSLRAAFLDMQRTVSGARIEWADLHVDQQRGKRRGSRRPILDMVLAGAAGALSVVEAVSGPVVRLMAALNDERKVVPTNRDEHIPSAARLAASLSVAISLTAEPGMTMETACLSIPELAPKMASNGGNLSIVCAVCERESVPAWALAQEAETGRPCKLYLVFRGSQTLADVMVDLVATKTLRRMDAGADGAYKVEVKKFGGEATAGFHAGMWTALSRAVGAIITELNRVTHAGGNDQIFQLVVAGHSLGGGYSQMFALDLLQAAENAPRLFDRVPTHMGVELHAMYTFGAPQVIRGMKSSLAWARLAERTTMFVHGCDVVPRLLGDAAIPALLLSLAIKPYSQMMEPLAKMGPLAQSLREFDFCGSLVYFYDRKNAYVFPLNAAGEAASVQHVIGTVPIHLLCHNPFALATDHMMARYCEAVWYNGL